MESGGNEGMSRALIRPDWLPTYEAQLNALSDQAVELTNSLLILRQLVAFPAATLGVQIGPMLVLLERSLFVSCTMILGRIVVDSRSDTLTLQRFRDALVENLVSDDAKRWLNDRLENLRFDEGMTDLRAKIRHLRNKRLAHLDVSVATGFVEDEGIGVTLGELQGGRDAACELISELCLDAGRSFYYLDYSPDAPPLARLGRKRDIDEMLDAWGSTGTVVNMPEREPAFWERYKQSLSEEELGVIREFRRRLDMPEI